MNKIKMLFVCILLLFSVIGCNSKQEPKIMSKYHIGEMVCLKLNSSIKGQIIRNGYNHENSVYGYEVRLFQRKSKTNTHLLEDDGYIDEYILCEKWFDEFELVKCE